MAKGNAAGEGHAQTSRAALPNDNWGGLTWSKGSSCLIPVRARSPFKVCSLIVTATLVMLRLEVGIHLEYEHIL